MIHNSVNMALPSLLQWLNSFQGQGLTKWFDARWRKHTEFNVIFSFNGTPYSASSPSSEENKIFSGAYKSTDHILCSD